jgi:N-acetylglucosaminyl-diphospho-decaprenol L-rhamnosyltransferase
VTYQSARHVAACLEAVGSSPQVKRLIVVDNASTDGSADAARAAGAGDVLENRRNGGFACAVNRGLGVSDSGLVLLLNPDAVLEPASLSHLCATIERVPGAAIVAPLLRDGDGMAHAGAGRLATVGRRVGLCLPVAGRAPAFRPQYRLPDGEQPGVADVGYVFGAALLVDGRFLARAGGLDERYFLFAEDEDICRQAHRAGRRVLLDGGATAAHAGGASSGDEAAIEAQRLCSTWRLFAKWDGSRHAAAYHRGILAAFRLRAAAAALDAPRRASIGRTARLFDEAVRTGVDPLVRLGGRTATNASDSSDGP